MPSLTSLAEEALVQARKLDDYLESQGRRPTSFETDTLFDLPPDLTATRENLINTTQTLKRLAQRPEGVFEEIMWSCTDEISLGAINEFNLAHHIPLTGCTTYADLAARTGVPAPLLERILRHSMANHIFTEHPPGQIHHTASSALLASDPDLHDAIAMMARETWQLAPRAVDAMRQHLPCEEPGRAAFALVNDAPGVPMFEFLARCAEPERTRRFGGAMRYFGSHEAFRLEHLVRGYSWEAIDRPGARVVDVGGGQGWVARALAEATRHVRFVVQDLAGTVRDGRAVLPRGLEGRVEFAEHDFFAEQPVRGADVYFLRWILHDWSDKYAVRILRALVPALEVGGKVVVYERVLSDGPETRLTERQGRNADLAMLAQFNGRERTARDFIRLFREADERFCVTGFERPRGSGLTIVEVVWGGTQAPMQTRAGL